MTSQSREQTRKTAEMLLREIARLDAKLAQEPGFDAAIEKQLTERQLKATLAEYPPRLCAVEGQQVEGWEC